MKKLIVSLAAVAAAAGVQAATIMWGGDVCREDCATEVKANSVAYLVYGTTAAEAAITSVTVDGTDFKNWTTDTGAKIVQSHTINAEEAGAWGFSETYPISGSTDVGYYSIVVVDGSAGAAGLKGSYNYAGYNQYDSPTSGDLTNFTIGKDGWNTWIGDGGFEAVSFTAAPEPTSGLLLLVGIAGLALRRRRA